MSALGGVPACASAGVVYCVMLCGGDLCAPVCIVGDVIDWSFRIRQDPKVSVVQ